MFFNLRMPHSSHLYSGMSNHDTYVLGSLGGLNELTHAATLRTVPGKMSLPAMSDIVIMLQTCTESQISRGPHRGVTGSDER